MKAIELLETQISKAGKNTPVAAVGYLLVELCKRNAATAQLVEQDLANKSMSIDKCYQKLYQYAADHKKGSVYAMTPSEAERLTCEFYGIPYGSKLSGPESTQCAAPMSNVISLDDLL